MPTKQILAVLVMTIALAGCTNKKTESETITKVLEYDKFVGARASDILAPLQGESEEERRKVVEVVTRIAANMRKAPLEGCPKDFQEAYLSHIEAWAALDSARIGSTWLDVVSAARLHGVVWNE